MRPRLLLPAIVTASAVASVNTVRAVEIAIVNPGFEDVAGAEVTYNEFTFGAFPGWSFYDPSGAKGGGAGGTYYVGTLQPTILPAVDPVNYQNFPEGAPQGSRVAIAFNFAGSGGSGEYGLQQTLSETLAADTYYSLTALIGNIASGTASDSTYCDLRGFPGYRVDLLAGGTVVASDNNSLAGTIPEGQFAPSTTTYTSPSFGALIGQQLSIRLVNLNNVDAGFPDADLEVDFDDIVLTATPIPEPAAVVVCAGLAAAGVVGVRRRRRVG